jgi:UDP-N-acetylmuramoylalanine--D-glutamate ligase
MLTDFQREFPNIPMILDGLKGDTLNAAREIILSPGLAQDLPEVVAAHARGVPILGDIELFARAAAAPIIAITGSNGKSTVTTLVAELLAGAGKKVAVGGNLGLPALDLLTNTSLPDFYVLELSSFQLETTYSLRDHIACVLNVCEDHLDRYATMADYVAAKQRIYHQATTAVIYAEDLNTIPPSDFNGAVISFALTAPTENQFGIIVQNNETYLAHGQQLLLPVSALKMKGQHNWLNALAALALISAAGVDLQKTLPALQQFVGLPHRCEWVTRHHNIDWYNDSKGTNVGATLAALRGIGQSISGKIIWIAGGQGKGADFTSLRAPAATWIRAGIFIGQDAGLLATAIGTACPTDFASTLLEAVQLAAQKAQPGDVILLSPACASLDMFVNFEDRGNQFKHIVREHLQ